MFPHNQIFVLKLLLQHEDKRKKLTRAERKERARQEEEHLRAVEQKLMDSETGPQSADDFDRLVLSSPNSSLCWIKYMAFHLQVIQFLSSSVGVLTLCVL
jgi:rRNA biogenesis protein RRP5